MTPQPPAQTADILRDRISRYQRARANVRERLPHSDSAQARESDLRQIAWYDDEIAAARAELAALEART